MTERTRTLTVVLDDDMREDDVESVVRAILCLIHVAKVQSQVGADLKATESSVAAEDYGHDDAAQQPISPNDTPAVMIHKVQARLAAFPVQSLPLSQDGRYVHFADGHQAADCYGGPVGWAACVARVFTHAPNDLRVLCSALDVVGRARVAVDNENAMLRARVAAHCSATEVALASADQLRKERDEARVAGECDACSGTGTSALEGGCMCGGSGRASSAVIYLREQLFDERRRIRTLQQVIAAVDRGLLCQRDREPVGGSYWIYESPCLRGQRSKTMAGALLAVEFARQAEEVTRAMEEAL